MEKAYNHPTVCMVIGLVIGLTGLGEVILNTTALNFVTDTLSKLGACMGPVAMLLAGVTVARFPIKKMLSNKKIYIATALRLVILPIALISALFGIIQLANLIFNINMSTEVLFLYFFIVATPLGLNTVVFPEAYGGDPSIGAGMAIVSHTLCVITIPLLFSLLAVVLGYIPTFVA